jgi:hypothetical protein
MSIARCPTCTGEVVQIADVLRPAPNVEAMKWAMRCGGLLGTMKALLIIERDPYVLARIKEALTQYNATFPQMKEEDKE